MREWAFFFNQLLLVVYLKFLYVQFQYYDFLRMLTGKLPKGSGLRVELHLVPGQLFSKILETKERFETTCSFKIRPDRE